MEKWMVAAKKADFDRWAQEYKISPVLARIIRNRDIVEDEQINLFLNGGLKDCHSPWLLQDMDRAIDILCSAMEKGIYIRVIGDYDVDGICSAYILTKGLSECGARVDTAIPHRIKDGYGLNDALIEEAREDGVGLILTCDNGIAAAEQVALAKSYGIQVVVTDHHEVPYQITGEERVEILPAADAVVDPKRADCSYPFKSICGGMVAYKLIQALTEKLSYEKKDWLEKYLLPFAAMATVCDVMELKDENRIIVREGLKCFATTENYGLQALMEVNCLEKEAITGYHMGFVMGPCLNATGRLDSAVRALELLQSSSKQTAMKAARELKELNDSRKNLTLDGVKLAREQIEEQRLYEQDIMVVYLPQVHESLAGIIAGRIREQYYHPVFVLTDGDEGVKGSGRSIDSYHMYDSMVEVKELFTKFGGHKLAAGLSLPPENVAKFRALLNEKSKLKAEDFVPVVHIDVPMPLSYASMSLAKEIEKLEPYGVGNPKPLFAQKDVIFAGGRRIGANKNFGKFTVLVERDGYPRREDLMYFGDLEAFLSTVDEKHGPGSADAMMNGRKQITMSVVYQLGINVFRGQESLQYIMTNYS
ncbi:MAG: single-stranded-DNA-specific exonuclease RecJ [Lachnospiraceae bacterium]|nr:single-stranded-DNA-specific exonuclease RecJ [Lachnospiraceae bacterium]